MDITNLDDHRKIWKTDAAACAACGHSWQAVYPVGAEDVGLECPACGSGLGSVLPNDDKSKLSPNDDKSKLSPNDDIVERLRQQNRQFWDAFQKAANEVIRLTENAKQDAQFLMAYHHICQKHGIAPSSSDLIEAMQEIAKEKESK